jgi:PKD repeat protein
MANGDYAAAVSKSVNFTSMGSKDTDGNIVSTLWDFGDDSQSTDSNPTHVYATAGSFTVSLTVTDNDGASHTDTALVSVAPIGVDIENACSTKAAMTGGTLTASSAECLGNSSTIWLSLGDVSAHQTVSVTTGHGQGNLDVLYSNSGWQSDSNYDAQSQGNGTTANCISLAAGSNYWSYLKVTGGATGATLLVEFDSESCQ